jgi:copper chaperone CopZ
MSRTINFEVQGMHCQSCAEKIKNFLESREDVATASISYAEKKGSLKGHIEINSINKNIQSIGDYHLQITGESLQKTAQTLEQLVTQKENLNRKDNLYPLFLIVWYIAGVSLLIAFASETFSIELFMRSFMAGFFLVFSFFKLLDLKGFVSAFRGYDIIAKRSEAWAFAYPFIELTLGVSYLLNISPIATNAVTLMIMLIGSLGVLKALLDKQAIQCACLGAVLNLPMTKITLVEDLGMAFMAFIMLVFFY